MHSVALLPLLAIAVQAAPSSSPEPRHTGGHSSISSWTGPPNGPGIEEITQNWPRVPFKLLGGFSPWFDADGVYGIQRDSMPEECKVDQVQVSRSPSLALCLSLSMSLDLTEPLSRLLSTDLHAAQHARSVRRNATRPHGTRQEASHNQLHGHRSQVGLLEVLGLDAARRAPDAVGDGFSVREWNGVLPVRSSVYSLAQSERVRGTDESVRSHPRRYSDLLPENAYFNWTGTGAPTIPVRSTVRLF
jgi:hypothetical protein